MKTQILIAATKGGSGKTTLVESLRQFLKNVEVVDLDHQKTLTTALQMMSIPLVSQKVKYTLYDTPPYNDEGLRALMEEVDHIIIPTKLGYPDMIALKAIYNGLIATKTMKKAILVFNEVRKPLTNESKEIMACYENNYSKLKVAKTLISRLDAFSRVFRTSLEGKALKQIENLVCEFLNK